MSATSRYAILALFGLLIGVVVAHAVGFRVYVIPPKPGIPDGFVAVVQGADFLMPFDSPDAMCERRDDRADTDCVARAITEVNETSSVRVRLPYVGLFAALAGVPADRR